MVVRCFHLVSILVSALLSSHRSLVLVCLFALQDSQPYHIPSTCLHTPKDQDLVGQTQCVSG